MSLTKADDYGEGLAALASKRCGVPLVISHANEASVEALMDRLSRAPRNTVLRTLRDTEEKVMRAANRVGLIWINAPKSAVGRFELTC